MADKHSPLEDGRVPALVWGLIFGPSVGMLVALVFFGGTAIGWGLSIGAGAGVAIGAIVDSLLTVNTGADQETGDQDSGD